MSELTQTLKIFVTRYPGTMAELARQSVDRPLHAVQNCKRSAHPAGVPAGAPGRRAGIERGREIRPAAAIQAAWPRPRSQAARRAAPPAGGLFPGGGFHPPRGPYLQRSRQPSALQRAVHRGQRRSRRRRGIAGGQPHSVRRYPPAAPLAVHKPHAGPCADRTLFGSGRRTRRTVPAAGLCREPRHFPGAGVRACPS